jgi:large subunit ribosomal protein L23
MALFSKNKTQDPKAPAPTEAVSLSVHDPVAGVLRHARITEKATMHAGMSAYVFDVAQSATKRDITRAVFAVYKVLPRAVRIARVPSKMVRNARTGKQGVKAGGKKAYVYLKKGDTLVIS